MPGLDRATARALVDAGYMPLSDYVELFGGTRNDTPLVPDMPRGADFQTGEFVFVGAYECGGRGH